MITLAPFGVTFCTGTFQEVVERGGSWHPALGSNPGRELAEQSTASGQLRGVTPRCGLRVVPARGRGGGANQSTRNQVTSLLAKEIPVAYTVAAAAGAVPQKSLWPWSCEFETCRKTLVRKTGEEAVSSRSPSSWPLHVQMAVPPQDGPPSP